MSAEHLRETQNALVQLRKKYDALESETKLLRDLFDAVEWLTDPTGTIMGINPGPELQSIQRAFDAVREVRRE